jgi:diguanylate cyclase (GGDEF)-like protein
MTAVMGDRAHADSVIKSPAYMWRVAGLLLGFGATIGALALLAPHPETFDDRTLWINVAVSFISAGACVVLAPRLPAWPLYIVVGAAVLVVTRAAYATHDPSGFYALVNVWIGLYAVFFFSRKVAIAYLIGIAGAYAWLLFHFDTPSGLARWITGMGTVCLGAFMIDSLLGRVRQIASDNAQLAAEREQLATSLAEVARTDELTGLGNRRAWDEEIARELNRAERDETPLCVAIVDLDDFKRYNDLNGHIAGDRLLKELASAWTRELRATDVLARYGGEEFALALPGCSMDDATTLIERLRVATPAGETCSAGIVLWDGVEAAEDLVGRADMALYDAKETGRDKIVAA